MDPAPQLLDGVDQSATVLWHILFYVENATLNSTSKRQSKKRLFYISHRNFWFTIAITKIKLELDWLIEPIVEPKNLFILFIFDYLLTAIWAIGVIGLQLLQILKFLFRSSWLSFPLTINQKRIRSNQNWIKIIVNAWQSWST